MVDLGYGHFRVDHSSDEFTEGAVHINGIAASWPRQGPVAKFKVTAVGLDLKETEWRYNDRRRC